MVGRTTGDWATSATAAGASGDMDVESVKDKTVAELGGHVVGDLSELGLGTSAVLQIPSGAVASTPSSVLSSTSSRARGQYYCGCGYPEPMSKKLRCKGCKRKYTLAEYGTGYFG